MQNNLPAITLKKDNYRTTIVAAIFHQELMEEYIQNTVNELKKQGVKEKNITIIKVSGALEIPYICQQIVRKQKPEIILALAVIIRGQTTHYDLVSENTLNALMQIQLQEKSPPIAFGVLACENFQQAKERISKKGQNKASQIVQAVINQQNITQNLN